MLYLNLFIIFFYMSNTFDLDFFIGPENPYQCIKRSINCQNLKNYFFKNCIKKEPCINEALNFSLWGIEISSAEEKKFFLKILRFFRHLNLPLSFFLSLANQIFIVITSGEPRATHLWYSLPNELFKESPTLFYHFAHFDLLISHVTVIYDVNFMFFQTVSFGYFLSTLDFIDLYKILKNSTGPVLEYFIKGISLWAMAPSDLLLLEDEFKKRGITQNLPKAHKFQKRS